MHRFRLNGACSSARMSLRVLAALASALFCFQQAALCQKKQKLEENYREWLARDVAYIITKDEKDAFLRLTTNEARDKFIEDFWRSEEHTSELQSRLHLVCRLLLEKKKK